MRLIPAMIGLVVLLAPASSAQTRGAGSHRSGNPANSALRPVIAASQNTFAARLGRTVSGRTGAAGPSFTGLPSAHRQPRRPVGPRVVGYVPAYYGYGDWGWGWAPPRPVPPPVVAVAPAPQPAVIVNQFYSQPSANPVVKEYAEGQLPEPASDRMKSYHAPVPSHPDPTQPSVVRIAGSNSDEPTIYLIAFKDQAIYPATGFWVENDTLHFVTTQGEHNRAPVGQVDRGLSERLNRERNVDFQLTIP